MLTTSVGVICVNSKEKGDQVANLNKNYGKIE